MYIPGEDQDILLKAKQVIQDGKYGDFKKIDDLKSVEVNNNPSSSMTSY